MPWKDTSPVKERFRSVDAYEQGAYTMTDHGSRVVKYGSRNTDHGTPTRITEHPPPNTLPPTIHPTTHSPAPPTPTIHTPPPTRPSTTTLLHPSHHPPE